jgi:LCP family protein required for cell wall assembly
MRHFQLLRLFYLVILLLIISSVAACQADPAATAVSEAAATTAVMLPSESATSTQPSLTEPAPSEPEPIAESAGAAVAEPPTDTPQPDESPAPSRTPQPPATSTPRPTVTPTSRPQTDPTRAVVGTGSLSEGIPTPASPIPSPVPTFEVPEGTTNILLLGSDVDSGDETDGRTDTMIIVSVNSERGTASMISLPRDLYVYHPTRTMGRLNTAEVLGGPELLEQTILYNFGIPINYYAQVNFNGFKQVVDTLGGLEVAVSCQLRDWRLKSPELDPSVEDNWEMYTLTPGIYQMDGNLALWYARSRLTTSDFDRGRRQQQLLRAMLDQGVNLGLVSQAPALWSTFQDVVNTDMDIGRILQLASLAPAISENGVQNLYLQGKTESWTVPDSGAQVQLPVWEGANKMGETFQRLFLPPALNRADRAPIVVEVVNGTSNPDLARLAADNLAWYGFVPVIDDSYTGAQATTVAEYYGPNFKGSYNWLMSWIAGNREAETVLMDDPEYPYDYRLILGEDYDPCLPAFYAPQADLSGDS